MTSYSSIKTEFQNDDAKKEVSIEDAEKAVKTLITWIGDNPDREGLIDTPKRVVRAFNEHFSGYKENPSEILSKTFKEVQGYDDIVVLKKIDFESHCEHHMLPIIGEASVGYLPNKSIVGISKLARIVNTFAKRLQTQEIMTSQIINAIQENLNPLGVGVVIEAEHHCMKTRGVYKKKSLMRTSQFKGLFLEDEKLRNRFLDFAKD
ncbi:MAG: GTP cyclohydrolase I FolE [SAR116 cluster bacterium]|nr:GTP cyclohydrolase I FolE [SAR116 cluster bacterium]RPH09719.1 MAG: GTP cyclohydrolase I FolE [Alphaproteobacteria bacterium TMED54]